MIKDDFVHAMRRALLLVLLMAFIPVAALAAEDSGRVVFLRGSVSATDNDGNARQLSRDDRVSAGDTLASGPKGVAQIVFPDNSLLYIKPDSEVQIAKYRYDEDQPQNDEAVVNVVKGGLRALTGVIGKRSQDKVKFTNRMATIGIRGTAVEIGEDTVVFDFGQGSMENESGSILIGPGESARAASSKAKIGKYFHERDPDDASVVAQVLVAAPLDKVVGAVEIACKTIPEEEAIFLMGIQNQVPGYRPEVTAATVQGLTVCYAMDEFGIILTASTLIFPGEAPQMLVAALQGRGSVEVTTALKAVLRGLDRPDQALVNRVVDIAITEGNLDVDGARQVLQEVQEEGYCR
ncbi:MAG: FecR domain-containing protein [Gammaproteobacteria bacterium]